MPGIPGLNHYVNYIVNYYVHYSSIQGNYISAAAPQVVVFFCHTDASHYSLVKGPVGFPGDPGPPGEPGVAVSMNSLSNICPYMQLIIGFVSESCGVHQINSMVVKLGKFQVQTLSNQRMSLSQGTDGEPGEKGEDGEAGQPVSPYHFTVIALNK